MGKKKKGKGKYFCGMLSLLGGLLFCGIVNAATVGTATNGVELKGIDTSLVYGVAVEFTINDAIGTTTEQFNTDGSTTVGNGNIDIGGIYDLREIVVRAKPWTSDGTCTIWIAAATSTPTVGSNAWAQAAILSITGTSTIILGGPANTLTTILDGSTTTVTANRAIPYCKYLCIGTSGTMTTNISGTFVNFRR